MGKLMDDKNYKLTYVPSYGKLSKLLRVFNLQ